MNTYAGWWGALFILGMGVWFAWDGELGTAIARVAYAIAVYVAVGVFINSRLRRVKKVALDKDGTSGVQACFAIGALFAPLLTTIALGIVWVTILFSKRHAGP